MQVLVNDMPDDVKYEYYRGLRHKILGSNSGLIPLYLLIEWDKARLELNPRATQLEVKMGKEKVTAETLMGACSTSSCCYNEGNFCTLQEIILDSDGRCIYKSSSSSGSES